MMGLLMAVVFGASTSAAKRYEDVRASGFRASEKKTRKKGRGEGILDSTEIA